MFWRQAVESGQVTGAEAGALPLARNIARIVAVPITVEDATRGVLLAGLPRGRTSLESLERLEQRALLAAQVLQQKERRSERARSETWRLALLEASEQPVVLVDRSGFLRGMSLGARKILWQDADPSLPAVRWNKPELRFVELLRPREWERASCWLQSGPRRPSPDAAPEILSVQVKDGTRVECRRLDLSSADYVAVGVARAAAVSSERRKEDVEAELRQTVDWMTEGVAVFDETGGLRAANEHFYRLLGLTRDDAEGLRTLQDILAKAAPHAADPEEFARRWRAAARTRRGLSRDQRAATVSVAHGANRETCFSRTTR
jgi:PAS domain-containing protein